MRKSMVNNNDILQENNVEYNEEDEENLLASISDPNLFRKEIIEFENEYPGRYPIKTIFQMLEDLISNGETSFEKNVAILVDKFGPQILLQERFGENMIKHTINFIVEEDDPYKLSEDQIREILDLIFFENEYLIQETDAIEYAREEEKNKTADILEEILRGAAIKIEEQLDLSLIHI